MSTEMIDTIRKKINKENLFKIDEIFKVRNFKYDTDMKLIFATDLTRVVKALEEYKSNPKNIYTKLDILAGDIMMLPNIIVEDRFTVILIQMKQNYGGVVDYRKELVIYQP